MWVAMVMSVSVVFTRGDRSPKSQESVTGVTVEDNERRAERWTLSSGRGSKETLKSTANTSSASVHRHSYRKGHTVKVTP